MSEFPNIKSTHSLVAKHVTKEKWDAVKDIETKAKNIMDIKEIKSEVSDVPALAIFGGMRGSIESVAVKAF